MRSALILSALAGGAAAQNGAWAQCGGGNFQGPTSCVSGYRCVVVNEWYHQCQPGTAAPTTTSNTPPQPTTTPGPGTGGGKFKWFGLDESCAEFGKDLYPGTWGKEFIFPSESSMSTHISEGYNIFRVAFAMERLVPNQMTGAFSAAYLANLTSTVNYITSRGAWAVLDPHNFGRYYGQIISDVNAFKTFWTNVGGQFKNNAKVIFDTNNEYHDMDQTLVFNLNQASIDGVRAAGATSQYIFVEGNSWSGAWTWNVTNNNLAALKDPQNKIIYQMHQYLDRDGSGTSADCVSTNIGVQRVVGATNWLRQNNKLGILGEFAGGANTQCKTAVTGMLDHLKANSDVWTGALWWAGGPWWGNYIYSFEPPSGTGYVYYNSLLRNYIA